MRKFSKLLLTAVVALGVGFTACNNDDIDAPDVSGQKGNTHVSVTLKMTTGTPTRALADEAESFDNNYLGKWGGDDDIKNITVYLLDGTSVTSTVFTVGTDYTIEGAGSNTVTLKPNASAAIRTTAGMKTVYVVVNETAPVRNWLNKSTVSEFEQNYQNIALVLANEETGDDASSASKVAKLEADKDLIVMTNIAPFDLNVESNVSADETINGIDKNRASLQVQRAVARVMVTIADANSNGEYAVPNVGTDGPAIQGSLSDVTWVVAQGENSLFVQQKEDFATPNYGWVAGSDFIDQAGSKYDYSGLFQERANKNGGTDVPTWADYQANVPGVITEDNKWLKGKYLLPNTHEFADAPASGSADAYTGGYRKGNTAYVMIRATYVPVDEAFGDKDVAGFTYSKGQTFYVAKGKFYTSAQNAYELTGSTEIAKYVDGKVLYYAWVNPYEKPEWYNSAVLRNNIYHIHITGFKNLGVNWNPLYPEDPDNGKIPNPNYDPDGPVGPDNPQYIPNPDVKNPDPKPVPEEVYDPEYPETPITPEEPEIPIDPTDPLTTPETWMSVDVSILPWKVHSYEVELGI